MGSFALPLMAASTVLGAVGSIQQGNEQRQLANAQARQLDLQAAQERDAAVASAERIRRAGRTVQGQAQAAYAASGITVGQGTADVVDRQIGLDAETDAYMALLDGDRRGRTLQTEASATRRAGRNAQRAGFMGAATSLLSGAASYAMWSAGQPSSGGIKASPNFVKAGPALSSIPGA